jgi:hypothetical protein
VKISFILGLAAGWAACHAIDKWGSGVRGWIEAAGDQGRLPNPGEALEPDEILLPGQEPTPYRVPAELEVMVRNLVKAGARVWAERAFDGVEYLVQAATGQVVPLGRADAQGGEVEPNLGAKLQAIHTLSSGEQRR